MAAVPNTLAHEQGFANVRLSGENSRTGETKDFGYESMVAELRQNFQTRKTFSYEWRVKELKALRRGVVERQDEILRAVNEDLRRHAVEGFQGEVAMCVLEIDYTLKHLKPWMKPDPATVPIHLRPGHAALYKQPKGVALIIAPWNFPISLTIQPLVSAIAAGCVSVLKPSEMTPSSAKIIEEIVSQYLDPAFVRVVQGGVEETTALLKQRWDHIFYTGNGAVGRIVYRAAAEHLCSVTLELGGKSPVYVAEDANIPVTARRLLGTKLFNNGQVCVAPDYVLAHNSVKDQLISELKKNVDEWLTTDRIQDPSLTRLVNERHFDRIADMLKENHGGRVIEGGLETSDRSNKFIPPTIIVDPSLDSRLLREEIFGPIMPILGVSGLDEALEIINSKEASLASYVYTESDAISEKFIQHTTSGGTCVNDCVMHLAVADLPFGGTGSSGLGAYHGRAGFEEFTHKRAMLRHSTWLDMRDRYLPYKAERIPLLKKIIIGPFFPPQVVTAAKVAAAGAAATILLRSRM